MPNCDSGIVEIGRGGLFSLPRGMIRKVRYMGVC